MFRGSGVQGFRGQIRLCRGCLWDFIDLRSPNPYDTGFMGAS